VVKFILEREATTEHTVAEDMVTQDNENTERVLGKSTELIIRVDIVDTKMMVLTTDKQIRNTKRDDNSM
jgi:hypothetical protein